MLLIGIAWEVRLRLLAEQKDLAFGYILFRDSKLASNCFFGPPGLRLVMIILRHCPHREHQAFVPLQRPLLHARVDRAMSWADTHKDCR